MACSSSKDLLCPSAPAEVGSLLIGVVGADGAVQYIRDRLPITSEFLDAAKQQGSPEQRFRFSSRCVQGNCAQWKEGRCGLPDRLGRLVASDDLIEELPRCAIRSQCRWFAQIGINACKLCPIVTTRNEDPQSANFQTAEGGESA